MLEKSVREMTMPERMRYGNGKGYYRNSVYEQKQSCAAAN